VNKKLKSALQVLFSLGVGFFLIWYFYKDLTEKDKAHIVQSFEDANYWWIALSISIAILSHVFRAYRWRYPLESMNININFPNRFAAVMVGYLANLAFPRLGEVSRCAILSRYQKQPFEKLFGTVIAERVVDALVLVFIMIVTVLMQFSTLGNKIMEWLSPIFEKVQNQVIVIVAGVLGAIGAYIGWKFLQKSEHKLAVAFREKIAGLLEGIQSLKNMEGQVGFYVHTALIWTSYVAMYAVAFQAFPETSNVPFGGTLASFTMGGLTIVAVQGGLGAYPLGVMSVLLLYGIDKDLGYAFGWIVWCSQTIMIITVGFISLLIMPLINAKLVSEIETS